MGMRARMCVCACRVHESMYACSTQVTECAAHGGCGARRHTVCGTRRMWSETLRDIESSCRHEALVCATAAATGRHLELIRLRIATWPALLCTLMCMPCSGQATCAKPCPRHLFVWYTPGPAQPKHLPACLRMIACCSVQKAADLPLQNARLPAHLRKMPAESS